MKKSILLLLVITATSCDIFEMPERPPGPPEPKETINDSPLKDEHLMNEVSHGLHKIKINDSTTVLIYRGVESCTMIQLK
jgi:hypothetical protein